MKARAAIDMSRAAYDWQANQAWRKRDSAGAVTRG